MSNIRLYAAELHSSDCKLSVTSPIACRFCQISELHWTMFLSKCISSCQLFMYLLFKLDFSTLLGPTQTILCFGHQKELA